jgi:hypothetical protein
LPRGLSALVEQRAGPREADVLTIEHRGQRAGSDVGALLTAERPTAQIVRRTAKEIYASRANHIVVRHHLGRIVAIIDIVSPGNKDSRMALRDFVDKVTEFLNRGIHLLLVDLFPPTPRDPCGMHKVIWDQIVEEEFTFPAGKDRILASYEMGLEQTGYVEPTAVGDPMPDRPLFMASGLHVPVPLEAT